MFQISTGGLFKITAPLYVSENFWIDLFLAGRVMYIFIYTFGYDIAFLVTVATKSSPPHKWDYQTFRYFIVTYSVCFFLKKNSNLSSEFPIYKFKKNKFRVL